MKITIDTKDDSPEDIRKVIALLSKMIEGEKHSNIFEDSTPEGSEEANPSANAFANMFGSSPSESSSESAAESPSEDEEPSTIIEYD